jgi:hypothetical protein
MFSLSEGVGSVSMWIDKKMDNVFDMLDKVGHILRWKRYNQLFIGLCVL